MFGREGGREEVGERRRKGEETGIDENVKQEEKGEERKGWKRDETKKGKGKE